MIMAGAKLLGIGSAVYFRGADCFKQITDELELILKQENIKNINDVRGAAHI